MSSTSIPTAMKGWQYTTTKGGLIKNLRLNSTASLPNIKDPSSQHLVQIIASCLNPADFKAPEALPSFMVPKPATPGIDFVGRIVTPATGTNLKKGQLIFGVGQSPFARGCLAEYAVVTKEGAAVLPEGLKPTDAATIGIGGLTAYQAIVPYVKEGDRIFVNGGSGGVGVFAIQIAKTVGAHVTTSCSTANVGLVKSLGADEVIDYKKGSVLEALKSKVPFDHVVDNVGSDRDIYWKSHEYSKPSAKFVGVAGEPSMGHAGFRMKVALWPGFLGGGKRKYVGILAEPKLDELSQIGKWMAEGKVKAVIDSRFPLEQVPEAFGKLKTGRAKGKIMVAVTPETAGKA
jgi:NADPH:quinone reductase-like Zn-dependent oxidoreductase